MISADNVRYIGSLSRIYLKEKEINDLAEDLEKILHYVAKLEKLNISAVEPTSHVLPLKNIYREDKIKPPLKQKEALIMAVEEHKGHFKVPRVIG